MDGGSKWSWPLRGREIKIERYSTRVFLAPKRGVDVYMRSIMEKNQNIPGLAEASRIWLISAEKSKAIYVVWQESIERLGYSRIESADSKPAFVELSSVVDIQAHSKYLFAASQNALMFWTPDSTPGKTTTGASVFFELAEEAALRCFCFLKRQGRFALLWTPGGQRKAFVSLIDKKADVLAQTELAAFGIYDVTFLGLSEYDFFHLSYSSEKLYASLPDGTVWSAQLSDQESYLSYFEKKAQLRSPAVLIVDHGNDELYCICCLGDFCVLRTPSNNELSESVCPEKICTLRSGFPVIRAFPAGTAILAVGLTSRAFLTVDRKPCGNNSLLIRLVDLPLIASVTQDVTKTSSQSQSPLSKLRRLADPAEEQAMELLAEIELLEIQMALAMYLRFGAIDVKCDISQNYHPSLIQDNIVSCKLSAAEGFISSMWSASLSIEPIGSNVRCMRSTPFDHRGTLLSAQLECPIRPVCAVAVHLILMHRLLPRALPIKVQTQNICLRSSRGSPASCSLFIHQPLIECVFNDDIKPALERLIAPREVSIHSLPKLPSISRVVLQGTSRSHLLGQRMLLMLAMKEHRLPIEPRLLVNDSITQNIRTAQRELEECTSIEQILAFHEKWRNLVTFKLPLL
ncbi:uncharacterized protein LOC111264147 isoform X2 [Varroa jacobsoni]|uniref:uncharacterized protein LOC111264147 isoform X2 n=1 Tax=Varroa jacobsoni TaxID=62625 RepID=UPI000BF96261|nr:uncharacterized protein LOC111264147 isoform X2 [Varroa jacobsoni]